MKTCEKCQKTNRDEAKFCRFCGEKITVADEIGIIGKKTMQAEFDKLTKTLKVAKQLASMGNRVGLDCLIMGDAGTGKHYMAKSIADMMVKAGLTDKPVKEVAASEWNEFLGKFDENISALQNGILVINNAQKLLSITKADRVGELDKLFDKMKNGKAPIVILSGDINDMTNFLENNKDVAGLFEFRFQLDSFSIDDLVSLTSALLKKEKHMDIADEALPKLRAHFSWYMRQKELTYVNGRLAEKVANDLCVSAKLRGSDTIEAVDIEDEKTFVPKTEEQIFRELDGYIGLQSVKDEIRAIVSNVNKRKEKGAKEKLLKDHYLFTGNPGTGKTTFARKFGEILNAIGALPTGQFVEISGKDLIGQFVGDSEANVKNYVNKAMGGVLFIDEAYALMGNNGSTGGFGLDAVNTLLPLLENRKGEFVCIMAGYTKEMGEFIRMNPGLPSRCNVTIEFPDYTARELEQLFRKMLVSNVDDAGVFTLDAKAEEMLPKVFDRMYLKRSDTFGNAREVRNLFDAATKRHSKHGANDQILTYTDIVGEDNAKEISVDDVMKELDGFVGMKSVKDAIRRIAQEIAVQKQLIEMGEAQEGLTKYNFILTGNPGTGKTTVARIFGKIFKALGVTSTDKVTEKVPKDIIGMYVNESDKNMDKAINEAMGGVLFLDEAYDLEPMDEAGRSTSSEGKKAVQTLMTRMENEAGKFVVVCAGYPKQMATFMNSNPGLKRRFSHTIHIDDYTAEELLEIYERAAKAKKYNFTLADDTVRMKALNMFRNMVAMKDDKFGNAGEAMKKVAETKTNINNRVASVPYDQWTPEILQTAYTAYADDIPYVEPEKVSIDECLQELNQLIGLGGVKASLTKLAHTINNEIESARVENRRPEIPLGHYLFLGNPGTGKTTVARLMGKILYSMGALPSPNVVEVGKANLVGRYVGDTEAITSHMIDSAMGGILFIDEAYQLASDQFGRSALETLVARLENDRGKFVCIAAGYSFEMQQFLAENSGFESRFPKQNRIVFDDYSPQELFDIFMIHARKGGYTLDPMAENAVRGKLTMMYNTRGRTFGNGREARNLFDEVKSNLAARLAEEGGAPTAEERKTIKMEDVI
ncbi:MAG: AAA family ATPase [Bacteroidales bacterium]|nr:AAA family ATPase [Bacteroidales bacterium]